MKKHYGRIGMDLQLFAEGAAGGAGTGSAGTAAAAAGEGAGPGAGETGVTGQDAAAAGERAKRRNPLADVKYGKQPEESAARAAAAQEEAGPEAAQEPQAQQEESFDSLIRGKYKNDFDSRVQAIVQNRLKNSKEAEAKLEKLQPMLEALAAKNGLRADDVDGLIRKVTDDDSLYEDEALERGIPVETLKQIKNLERENQRMIRQQQEAAKDAQLRGHFEKLVRQGEEVAKIYPDFNLQNELRDPNFARLTSPGVGIDVRTAYEVVHRDRIAPALMQTAALKTAAQISASVRANGARPAENGVGSAAVQAAEAKADPSKWTKADREEVRRRVHRGEKIYL